MLRCFVRCMWFVLKYQLMKYLDQQSLDFLMLIFVTGSLIFVVLWKLLKYYCYCYWGIVFIEFDLIAKLLIIWIYLNSLNIKSCLLFVFFYTKSDVFKSIRRSYGFFYTVFDNKMLLRVYWHCSTLLVSHELLT